MYIYDQAKTICIYIIYMGQQNKDVCMYIKAKKTGSDLYARDQNWSCICTHIGKQIGVMYRQNRSEKCKDTRMKYRNLNLMYIGKQI